MADVPRRELWPKNCVRWSSEGFTTQPLMRMFRKPPLVSVPSLMALQWLLTMQFCMVMFSQRRGEVLFSVMPSSSLSASTSATTTS